MLSAVSKHILNFYQFDTKNMRTGVIPFASAKGYGLTEQEKIELNSLYVASADVTAVNKELDENRIRAMADRAKTMIVRLFEDVANFAKDPNERSNLTNALIQGLSFGIDRGRELLRFNFKTNSPIINPNSRSLVK